MSEKLRKQFKKESHLDSKENINRYWLSYNKWLEKKLSDAEEEREKQFEMTIALSDELYLLSVKHDTLFEQNKELREWIRDNSTHKYACELMPCSCGRDKLIKNT